MGKSINILEFVKGFVSYPISLATTGIENIANTSFEKI